MRAVEDWILITNKLRTRILVLYGVGCNRGYLLGWGRYCRSNKFPLFWIMLPSAELENEVGVGMGCRSYWFSIKVNNVILGR